MKILLSWIADYLNCRVDDLDIKKIVHLFNTRTAEIEAFERVEFSASKIFIAQVESFDSKKVTLFCPELKIKFDLPVRSDARDGKVFLVAQGDKNWRWVSMAEFGSDKEGNFPAISVSEQEMKGSWRKKIEEVDYVLDIDNKSINHRPDLWGHYGIAREISVFLNKNLKPLSQVLVKQDVLSFDSKSKKDKKNELSVAIEDSKSCMRLAALVCNNITYQDSQLWMAIRLLRVGAKPVNSIVDMTNYVMFDIGHPMHVFDAQTFKDQEMVIRKSKKGESLKLLDGHLLKLTDKDLVVTNGAQPVALAGIMGGQDSGYQPSAKNIILEAAGFEPATIRKTAQHFKLRTEASMRFEKHLDPMQNVTAIQRFLYLAREANVLKDVSASIISVGAIIKPKSCDIEHEFIEQMIGDEIKPAFIEKTLTALGFEVSFDKKNKKYHVVIPTYRATKDIDIKEDILEEIIRSYGFENIKFKLPERLAQPFSTQEIHNISYIKRFLAYGLHMHELREYNMYDAPWTQKLSIPLKHAITVKNPLSENWTTMVTSLIPHMLKGVEQNSTQKNHLRFFEFNPVWHKASAKFVEQKMLSGIIFDKKQIDFYAIKEELQGLWDLLSLPVTWSKPKDEIPAWYDAYQVAQLWVGKKSIGFAGMLSAQWVRATVSGQAFIFELDGVFLESLPVFQKQLQAWSKYQQVVYDISLFVPLKVAIADLQQAILKSHALIRSVDIVDFFEKDEWPDVRSVTLRYVMSDLEKTMTKKELEEITDCVQKAVKKYDAKVR